MNRSLTKLATSGEYISSLKDIFLSCTKYCYFCKPCFVLCFLASTFIFFFFYFLNCAVSFVYSLTSDSDERMICCLDLKKNTTWTDNKSVVSSKDISDQRNDLRTGSGIPPPCLARTTVLSQKIIWNHTTVFKLFVDRKSRYHITVWKNKTL